MAYSSPSRFAHYLVEGRDGGWRPPRLRGMALDYPVGDALIGHQVAGGVGVSVRVPLGHLWAFWLRVFWLRLRPSAFILIGVAILAVLDESPIIRVLRRGMHHTIADSLIDLALKGDPLALLISIMRAGWW